MQVQFYPNAGHSPAWPFVPDAITELDKKGLSFPQYVGPAWNDPCMVSLDDDGHTVGFLVYRYDEQKCSWFIMLAWVAPAHRRKGIHTAMFDALVERAKARGDILSIECGTHIDNTEAQATFAAQGRAKVAIMYAVRIKDFIDGKQATDTA